MASNTCEYVCVCALRHGDTTHPRSQARPTKTCQVSNRMGSGPSSRSTRGRPVRILIDLHPRPGFSSHQAGAGWQVNKGPALETRTALFWKPPDTGINRPTLGILASRPYHCTVLFIALQAPVRVPGHQAWRGRYLPGYGVWDTGQHMQP